MALYDYKCEKCGHIEEVAHPMNDLPSVVCPECGGNCSKTFLTMKFEKHFEGSTWEEDHNRVRSMY